MVTLTGPGGIGKTRLAEEVVASIGPDFAAGAVSISLVPAAPDDDLAAFVARQVGHESLDAFRIGATGISTLVFIDNCEHVQAKARQLADQLLDDPDLTLLVTSRIPLGCAGEHVVEVRPLGVPADEEDSDALRLFVDRSVAAGAEWPHSPENLAACAEIVRRLDGVPLAIELAAARSRLLAPTDLVTYLSRQLDLLEGAVAAGPERHRSIRSAIQASYAPLEPAEKALFRLISVLADGADLELIQAMTPDIDSLTVLDTLGALVRHSLVEVTHDEGHTTYRQLEPIRAFGREQLDVGGEEAEAAEAYVAAVTAFADSAVASALVSFSAQVLDRIAGRYSHLMAAIELALRLDDDPGRSFRLFLPFYAPTRAPRSEVATLGRRIRERWPDADAPFRAEAFAVMAHSSMWGGHDDAAALAAIARDAPEGTALARTIAHRVLAFRAGHRGDRDTALREVEAAISEAAAVGGSFERELRVTWASLVDDPARRDEAITVLAEQQRAASGAGETVTVVWALVTTAHHQLLKGDLDGAMHSAEQALASSRKTRTPWATCASLRVTAAVMTMRHDWDAAFTRWREAFDSVVSVGDVEGVALTLRSAAGAAEFAREGDVATALWELAPSEGGASSLPALFQAQQTDLEHRHHTTGTDGLPEIVRAARSVFSVAQSPDGPNVVNPAVSRQRTIRFGGHEIDQERRLLRDQGRPVHVEPQVFDVLTMLASRPGVLVSKEEILDEVWGDRFVSASALTSRIKSARAAVGDDGKTQNVIRTVHGKGFMFVARVNT